MTVPFTDLARAVAAVQPEISAAIDEVLASGWFVLGEQCSAFEAEFAQACGSDYAVGVASGTDALELALRSLEVGVGDEVVTQANTCVPTVAAIARAGGTPVLCDVDADSATMDVDSLAGAIGPRTRAIMPVHLYGQMAEMKPIRALAERHGLAVVEDCAHAHGAMLHGGGAGTMGAVGCFSFYPTKNLGAVGDAGAIVTADRSIFERVRRLRHYGRHHGAHHVTEGGSSRLDELQAAVLRVKLRHLGQQNRRREHIASLYTEALRDTPVRPLQRLGGRLHAFHLYVLRVADRESFRAGLRDCGVETLVHYPRPIHGHDAYRQLGVGPVSLRNAEHLARTVVSLPVSPHMTTEEIETVAHAAREQALTL